VPENATWKIMLPEGSEITWADVALIMMVEPEYQVTQGRFGGPQGMPIRGVRFHDASDLSVEVPMPLAAAQEMGKLLVDSRIEIAQAVPSGLIVAQRKPLIAP
jgi:hypothetical protein